MAYNGRLQMFRGIPLNIGNEDTLYFETRAEQEAYFDNFLGTSVVFGEVDYKFIREKSGYVKVNRPHDYLENFNYMRFENESRSSLVLERKWYYAFVTGLEYISDSVTGVYFDIDILQTWLPHIDYELNECLIERQHSVSDDIGDNLATEFVQPYKLKSYEEESTNILGSEFYVCVLFTYYPGFFNTQLTVEEKTIDGITYSTNFGSTKIDRFVTGSTLLLFKVDSSSGALNDDSLNNLREAIRKTTVLTSRDYIEMDTITAIYAIPKEVVDEEHLLRVYCGSIGSSLWAAYTPATRYSYDGQTWHDYPANPKTRTIQTSFSIDQIGSFEPENRKLLTSQYMNYQVINTEGNTAIFEPEGFTKRVDNVETICAPEFVILGSYLPPAKMFLRIGGDVDYYYGAVDTNDQLFSIGDLPPVTLNIDTYHAWLEKQFLGKTIMATGAILGGISTYNQVQDAATFAGGFSQRTGKKLYGTAKKLHTQKLKQEAKTTFKDTIRDNVFSEEGVSVIGRTANDLLTMNRPIPQSAGNGNNAGNIMISHGLFSISIKKIAPVESELKRIDDYFTAYGYAQNIIAKPKVKVRTKFTYIKTRGARNTSKYSSGNLNGIPAEYMEEINNAFDNGIRFWLSRDLSTLAVHNNNILPDNEQK